MANLLVSFKDKDGKDKIVDYTVDQPLFYGFIALILSNNPKDTLTGAVIKITADDLLKDLKNKGDRND